MNCRDQQVTDRAARDAQIDRRHDRGLDQDLGATFESCLYAVIVPAEMNRGDVGSVVRGRPFMAAVMRDRRLGVTGSTRRFARNARERSANDRQGEHNACQRSDHQFWSIRKFLRNSSVLAKINDVYERVRHGQVAGRAVITP